MPKWKPIFFTCFVCMVLLLIAELFTSSPSTIMENAVVYVGLKFFNTQPKKRFSGLEAHDEKRKPQELTLSQSPENATTQVPNVKTRGKDLLVSKISDESPFSTFRQIGNLIYDDIPQVRVTPVNCAKLIRGDQNEQVKAATYQKQHRKIVRSDEEIYSEALNCSKFLSNRRYIKKPASEAEKKFPLAFSILLFKDVELFERLLRAIYRPQNFYCIHVDKKSPKSVQDAVGAIVKCFENVFMAPDQFEVRHSQMTVLSPELSCMRQLLKHKKWKYFINLTGQEFPLKTNWEIIEILKIFNGSNNLEGTVKRGNPDRTAHKPPPPSKIRITKGSVHILASRGFVDYMINNETAIKFLDWLNDTLVPDETFFSTLNYNPHLKVPGSYLGEPETDTKRNVFLIRFKNWGNGPFNWPCGGKRVRGVCIFAVRDLPLLASRVELFANKFHIDYEPLTLDCLEELHYNRTRNEIASVPDIDRKYYQNMDYVRNHV